MVEGVVVVLQQHRHAVHGPLADTFLRIQLVQRLRFGEGGGVDAQHGIDRQATGLRHVVDGGDAPRIHLVQLHAGQRAAVFERLDAGEALVDVGDGGFFEDEGFASRWRLCGRRSATAVGGRVFGAAAGGEQQRQQGAGVRAKVHEDSQGSAGGFAQVVPKMTLVIPMKAATSKVVN